MYEPRTYRESHSKQAVDSFTVGVLETDLWIGVDKGSLNNEMKSFVLERIFYLRSVLNTYNNSRADFFTSYLPLSSDNCAPQLVKRMLSAAQKSGTGPMSSVAGLFADYVGDSLKEKFHLDNIIVENGGDNYLSLSDLDVNLPILAGDSPISGQLAIRIRKGETPLGVCTSSGTNGHSFSYGNAHSVTVISRDIVLADAFATKLCNITKSVDHIEKTLDVAMSSPGISACVIIMGNNVGIKGDCELIRIKEPDS